MLNQRVAQVVLAAQAKTKVHHKKIPDMVSGIFLFKIKAAI